MAPHEFPRCVAILVCYERPLLKCPPLSPHVACSQGNKSGLVGCGFWNNNCGGLNLTVAWQIVYITIAILVTVVFPFLMFMYESDDEGITAAKAGAGKLGQMCDVAACGRAVLSAICYEMITLAIAIPILILTWTYLGVTWIPVKATSIDVSSGGAFLTPSECGAWLVTAGRCTWPDSCRVWLSGSLCECSQQHRAQDCRMWQRQVCVYPRHVEDECTSVFSEPSLSHCRAEHDMVCVCV